MGTDSTQHARRHNPWFLLLLMSLTLGCAATLLAAPPALGAWQIVFSDHFSGKYLNEAYWTDTTLSGAPASGTTSYGMILTQPLITKHRLRFFISPQKSLKQAANAALGATGPVQTASTCHLQYGYLEMRIRLPKGPYVCEARLLPIGPTPSTASITLFTTKGASPGGLYGGVSLSGTEQSQTVTLGDPATDYTGADHLLGLSWTPQQLIWYLDGLAVAHAAPAPQGKMYLSLAFRLTPTPISSQHPLLNTAAEFLVSDVRIYQQVGEIDTAPPLVLTTQLATHLALETTTRNISVSPEGTYSTDTYYAARHYVSAITLLFDEPLDKASAEDSAHYQVDGARVKRAKLDKDQRTVELALTKVYQQDLSLLHITAVKDLAGNTAPLTITIGDNPFASPAK
jgi:hypothetical protein